MYLSLMSRGLLYNFRMGHFVDITGKRFNRLTVLSVESRGTGVTTWRVKCECGNIIVRHTGAMKLLKSCGCIKLENKSRLTHGMSNTPEFAVWKKAKERCFSTSSKNFRDYGGRGITMCAEWKNDFSAFFRDMGYRPVGGTLDRIDCNGHYEPSNCRWATRQVQAENRRNNIYVIDDNGSRVTLTRFSKSNGVAYSAALYRVQVLGETPQEAIDHLKSKKGLEPLSHRAKRHGVKPISVYMRMKRYGETVDQAIDHMVRHKNRKAA
jgi:hypothetical protein